MKDPRKAHSAFNRKESENFSGHHNTTYHQTDHRKKHQNVHCGLENPARIVLSFQQILISFPVYDMMEDEEEKHCCSKPFVCGLPDQHISHLA